MNENILSIFGILLTVVGFVIMWVQGVVKNRERMAVMETKMEIFWRGVAYDNARILHTPHPENKRRDEILEKFVDQTITIDELKELVDLLHKIIENKNREFGERTAASNLLRAIEFQYKL
jgi:hypothetical protein